MRTNVSNQSENVLKPKSGWAVLFLAIFAYLASIGLLIGAAFLMEAEVYGAGVPLRIISILYMCFGPK